MNRAIKLLTQANKELTDDHYLQLLGYAQEHTDRFWEEVAEVLSWHTPFSAVRKGEGSAQRWFDGGKINYYQLLFEEDTASSEAVVVLKRDGSAVTYSFAELQQKVDVLAHHLRQVGLAPGQTLVMSTPRRELQMLLALACLAIGARFNATFFKVPNPGLVAQCVVMKPHVVVVDEQLREGGMPQFAATDLSPVVVSVSQILQWLQAGESVVRGAGYVFDAADPTFYLASSGTTGVPKAIETGNAGMLIGALVTYYLTTYIADESREYLGLDLAWGPAFILGVYIPLMMKKTLVLTEEYLDFTQVHLIQRLKEERVTASTLPISLFDSQVVTSEKLTLERLFLTGMALSTQTADNIQSFIETDKLTTVYGYGSSELAGLALLSFVSGNPLPLATTPLYPYPGVSPHISDNGQLFFSNTIPSVCVAIKDNQSLYESLWSPEGYFSTNDRAVQVGEQQYQLRGRLDTIVKIQGREVDISVLQAAITEHIERTVVVLAEEGTLLSFVVGGKDESLRDIIGTFVHEKFGSYAVPEIHFVSALPRTAAGKLDRAALLKELPDYGPVDRT